MDRHVFDKEMVGLFRYFRLKDFPNDHVATEWFEMLKKKLPNSAFEKAIRKLKDKDTLPRNLPKAIRAAWFEFTIENQQQIVQDFDYIKCSDCNSSGGFYVLIFDRILRKRFQYLHLCSECNNWRKIINDPGRKRVSADTLRRNKVPFKPINQVYPVFWDNDGWCGGYTLDGRLLQDVA